jgi:cytochrome c
MTMARKLIGSSAAVLLAWSVWLAAAERGTPAEAKAMLAKAVKHYEEVGRQQALADFTARKAPFSDRDLYVVCLSADRTIVAHGGFPSFVGQSSDAMKDADGKPLGGAIWDAANDKGDGAVRYRWINPVSGKTEPKVSYVQKAGKEACLVGAYNP